MSKINANNLFQFTEKWKGKNIDFDRYAGSQCADLVRQYIEDPEGWNQQSYWYRPWHNNGKTGDDGVLDGYRSWADGANSIVAHYGTDRAGVAFDCQNITKIEDLKEGDIVFFTVPTHQFGHVGVLTNIGKVPGNIEVFDQNATGRQDPCRWSNYPKAWFTGAIRKVIMEDEDRQPPQPEPEPCQKEKARIAKLENEIEQIKNQSDYNKKLAAEATNQFKTERDITKTFQAEMEKYKNQSFFAETVNNQPKPTSTDKQFWQSKKFLAMVIGSAFNIVAVYRPELKDVLSEANILLGTYLVGQSTIDAVASIKK